jgi:hypothetical protein
MSNINVAKHNNISLENFANFLLRDTMRVKRTTRNTESVDKILFQNRRVSKNSGLFETKTIANGLNEKTTSRSIFTTRISSRHLVQ